MLCDNERHLGLMVSRQVPAHQLQAIELADADRWEHLSGGAAARYTGDHLTSAPPLAGSAVTE